MNDDIRKELISALSNEIIKYSELVMTFRTRIGFTSWAGPVIILGAYVVATNGQISIADPNWIVAGLLILLLAAYLSSGFIAALIERQAWRQCNKLRHMIVKLANDANCRIEFDDYKDTITNKIIKAYGWAYFVLFIMIFAIAIVAALLISIPLTEQIPGGTGS